MSAWIFWGQTEEVICRDPDTLSCCAAFMEPARVTSPLVVHVTALSLTIRSAEIRDPLVESVVRLSVYMFFRVMLPDTLSKDNFFVFRLSSPISEETPSTMIS